MIPYVDDSDFSLYLGDVRQVLAQLPAESVHCVVTSPPYWGLRDYSTEGQLGLEATPDLYVQNMVGVFREVRRVLRRDGTCWLNIGDSYATGTGRNDTDPVNVARRHEKFGTSLNHLHQGPQDFASMRHPTKPKDLVGIPWRLAFALQADGWYLRADVIWAKPNPMPESVTDRPTKAHEYVFLLTRSPRYFYDADAIRETPISNYPVSNGGARHDHSDDLGRGQSQRHSPGSWSNVVHPAGRNRRSVWEIEEEPQDSTPKGDAREAQGLRTPERMGHGPGWRNRDQPDGRNRRSVWTIATEPYPDAHFATFPQALVEPCILAGTSERGCCPECGTPWERETAVGYEPTTRTPAPNKGRLGAFQERAANMTRDGFVPNREKQVTTTGWREPCNCRGAWGTIQPVPCTVLDPFMGSGTTALVARRLGRKSIGVELNPEYARLCAHRLRQLSLLA